VTSTATPKSSFIATQAREMTQCMDKMDMNEEVEFLAKFKAENKFMAVKNNYNRITLSMLTTYLGLNPEGRTSGLLLIDEVAQVFKNTFNPPFVGKPSSSEYFLGSEFLVTLYDGSRISNETKDSFKNGLTACIEKHGVSGSFFIQPGFLYNAMVINPDEDGQLARLLIQHAEKRYFNPTNDDMEHSNAGFKGKLLSSYA